MKPQTSVSHHTIRALLIDLDGVIRFWNPEKDMLFEQPAGLPAGAIRRIAFTPELVHPAISGKVSDELWRQQIAARLEQAFPGANAKQAVEQWSASPGEVDPVALDLVRACRRKVPVVLVTNATSRLDGDLAQLGISGEFDHVINSSAHGWIKPQRGIFEIALHAVGLPAHLCFFVDDTVENVVAAREFGMAAHCYRDAEHLRQELVRYKIA